VELYLHSPSTPSWLGAQLKHRDNFTFYRLRDGLRSPGAHNATAAGFSRGTSVFPAIVILPPSLPMRAVGLNSWRVISSALIWDFTSTPALGRTHTRVMLIVTESNVFCGYLSD
jgi:hypothetical protein